MEQPRCISKECKSCDPDRGCKFASEARGPFVCSWGSFEYMVRTHLGVFGNWGIRWYSTNSNVIIATLLGANGRVEVWGGNHRREVWFVGKGRRAGEMELVAVGAQTLDGSLQTAVREACTLAGIQEVLPI